MNLKEAYSILELPQTATQDEAKKKYRELTKKFHPDINKEVGAEDKFKKINEAYQCVQSGKGTDREEASVDFGGAWNPFRQQQQRTVFRQESPINLNVTISFKESVTGCKKEVKFSRKGKCHDCQGQGIRIIDNGCKSCGGRGQKINQRNNMVFITSCDACQGKIKTEDCSACKGEGAVYTDVSGHVDVPGGIKSGNILRLHGMGNYMGSHSLFGEQYTDAHLTVTVTPDKGMRIEGNEVVVDLQIQLLEALRGCSKSVPTIDGAQEIIVKPLSRHHDEIIIPRLGVNRTGNQKIVLDVKYPDNVDEMINLLVQQERAK